MLFPISSCIQGLSQGATLLSQGQMRTGVEVLQDELQIAWLCARWQRWGTTCDPVPRTKLSADSLPPHHAHLSIAGRRVSLGPKPEVSGTMRSRFRRYRVYLSVACAALPSLTGDYVLCLEDGHYYTPVAGKTTLVFNRHRSSAAGIQVVPNVDFARSFAHAVRRRKIDRALIPWHQRLPQAIWRGSPTGDGFAAGEDGTGNRRVQLCRASLRIGELTNFRLGRLVQIGEEYRAPLTAEGLLGDFRSPEQQVKHRWIVSIDGNAGEWEGMFWKLYSGSTVLMVASDWEQWYSSLLIPWKHFVPVAADLSDLEERVQWCQSHDDQCRQIGEQARQLLKTEVTYEKSLNYVLRALQS